MGQLSRTKGLRAEREVAQAFEAAGWTVRGLEGSGDMLAMNGHVFARRVTHAEQRMAPAPLASSGPPLTLHVECKRYGTRARFPEWLAQAKAEAPPGVPPLLVTRADRGEWVASLPLADLLELIG